MDMRIELVMVPVTAGQPARHPARDRGRGAALALETENGADVDPTVDDQAWGGFRDLPRPRRHPAHPPQLPEWSQGCANASTS
jgi:hypothetical protein